MSEIPEDIRKTAHEVWASMPAYARGREASSVLDCIKAIALALLAERQRKTPSCANYCQYAKDVSMLEHTCHGGCYYEKHGGPIDPDNLDHSKSPKKKRDAAERESA